MVPMDTISVPIFIEKHLILSELKDIHKTFLFCYTNNGFFIVAGYRNGNDGKFYERGKFSNFWSSSENGSNNAHYAYLKQGTSSANRNWNNRHHGFSVRFIVVKDIYITFSGRLCFYLKIFFVRITIVVETKEIHLVLWSLNFTMKPNVFVCLMISFIGDIHYFRALLLSCATPSSARYLPVISVTVLFIT